MFRSTARRVGCFAVRWRNCARLGGWGGLIGPRQCFRWALIPTTRTLHCLRLPESPPRDTAHRTAMAAYADVAHPHLPRQLLTRGRGHEYERIHCAR